MTVKFVQVLVSLLDYKNKLKNHFRVMLICKHVCSKLKNKEQNNKRRKKKHVLFARIRLF